MPDTLNYADAVRLLGGEKSRALDWFDRLTGGALLAASVPVPALLGIFDAKAEFVRLGHELVRGVSEKRSGLSRYGRTQRLEAAHAVIVVTAFFEALAEADLPFDARRLELTRAEQLTLVGSSTGNFTESLFATAAPVPGPHLPYPALADELVPYYAYVATRVMAFLHGLHLGDTLDESEWKATTAAMAEVCRVALQRHRELLTRLAVDFPEVSLWLGLHEHEATREEVRHLSVGLSELHRTLADLSVGRAPDERRAALAAAYAAELRRPILSSGDVPVGLTVPTLGEAYISPRYRIAGLDAQARPSDESWWAEQAVRDELWQCLVVHLTAPGATRAPLLVLGQPGSGKSVLTRVVAARLPAADFLVVRVVLRDVYAAGDLQDQIEQAIRDDTGERLDWPALARSAGDAMPVVLLDGFDELLQATGVSQTDYLRRVAAFQRREADQGRPLAVIVTSRTSVADRAQPPPGTLAIRLEPFDDARVTAWVQTWNRVNAVAFRAAGARPLDPTTVLSHRDLAEQPLLLLMLALYDAEGHDLRQAGELRQGDLYERLLRRFACREVVKQRDGLPDRELDRAVEEELRRLAVVAFAMFNRGAQWVTASDLDADLAALPFGGVPAGGRSGLRAPLAAAEVVLGRFFFVHRSRASGDDRRRETYEFLHATFGEYLVARLTAQVLDDLVARDAAARLPWGGEPVDDDLLHALLSYAVLSRRATVLGFLAEWLHERDQAYRHVVAQLLLRLFRAAPYATGTRRFDAYHPRRLRVPARYAAYTANLLLLLALAAVDEVFGGDLFPEADQPVDEWRAQVGLWRAQLDAEEWDSLSDRLALERLGSGRDRDVRIWSDDRLAAPPNLDLFWSLGLPVDQPDAGHGLSRELLVRLRRNAHLSCDVDAVAVHALEPFLDRLPTALALVRDVGAGPAPTAARTLLDAWLLPLRPATQQERRSVYLRCVRLAEREAGVVPDWDRAAFLRLLLDRLATDVEASAEVVVDVLEACAGELRTSRGLAIAAFRCVESVVGTDATVDGRLVEVVDHTHPAFFEEPEETPWADAEAAADLLARIFARGSRTLGVARAGRVGDLADRMALLAEVVEPDRKHRQDAVADVPEADS